MLQSFREKIQGIVAGVIVAIIALTFALWGIQNYLHTGGGTETAATVNGNKITQEQLRIAYEREKRQQMLKLGQDFSLDQKVQADLKKKMLNNLVKDEVLAAAAKNMGLTVGEQQLNLLTTQLPIFQVDGHFSQERMHEVLANLLYSEGAFVQEIGRSFMLFQLQSGIANTEFVLPNEVIAAEQLINQKRDFGFFIIDKTRFAKDITVTKNNIQEYYKEHQNDFLIPEKVSIQFIELKESGKDEQKFSDLYDKLTDLTYTSSDSLEPAAKALGLKINTTWDLSNPKIAKAAFSEQVLKQGYNSNPIEISPNDFIVLRIKDHIPEALQPLDKVSAIITQKLRVDVMQAKAAILGQEILHAMNKGASPAALSKQYNLAWHALTNVGREDKNADKQILQIAFATAASKAAATTASSGDVVVLQVAKIKIGEATANKNLSLQHDFGQYYYSLFVADLMNKAKIKYDENIH